MKLTRRQLRNIIDESLETKRLNEFVEPVTLGAGLLAGAVAYGLLKTSTGRSIIAKVLRFPQNVFQRISEGPESFERITGRGLPNVDKFLDLIADDRFNPVFALLEELAQLVEGFSEAEGTALNDALKPVDRFTPVGRLAAGTGEFAPADDKKPVLDKLTLPLPGQAEQDYYDVDFEEV